MPQMITVTSKGSFRNTENALKRMKKVDILSHLEKYGALGAALLASATPIDTGLTASSWTYEVTKRGRSYAITWRNTNTKSGVPIAILIQYGHANRDGVFYPGRDYINPVIQPLFDQIVAEIWKGVING